MIKPNALALALTLALSPLAPGLALAQTPTATPSQADVARYAQELLERNYPAQGPGAAVLVARGDTVLFRGARGEADIEAHTALSPDQLFRIGSVTKQFAAAGLMTLVEDGKVKLDDPLSKYVPGYPGGDKVTVLQLLNHTSGIKSYTGMPGYMDKLIARDLTTAQMIDVFKDQPVDFEPGSKWSYNNSGYVLVGAVIEAASGMAWYDYLDKALFKPLGMTNTGYGHDPKVAARQVKGYSFAGGKPGPMRTLSMTQPHAAGALVSTVDDLLKWNRALHEGRVLKDPTYSQMITPVGAAVPRGYGFGIGAGPMRGAPALEHSGGIFGFTSHLAYVPGPDITVVVLENDDGAEGREGPGEIARRLTAAALGNPYPVAKAVPVEAAVLKAAEGVYRFDAETIRVLRVVDGKLTAQRTGPRAVLTPIGPDDFLYEDGFNRLTLERDAKGAIISMRFFQMGDGAGIVGARTTEPLPQAAVGVSLPRAALDRVAGTYEGGGMVMKVFVDGGALKAQLPGQDPVTLRAASAVKFDIVEVEAALEFEGGETPAGQVTLRQGGQELVFKRKP